jgi:hypothetical protein
MKFNNLTRKALVAAVFAGMTLTSLASHGAVISSIFKQGVNTAQDTDAERLLDSTGSVKTTGAYAVGDSIESIISFDSVNSVAIPFQIAPPYQFTGYSKLVVSSIQILNDFGDADPTNDLVRLHFGTLGDTLVSLYERLAGDTTLVFGDTPATSIANITANQTFIGNLGLGKASDFWYADTINDASIIDTLPAGGGQVAAGQFGISLLTAGALPLIPDGILSPIDGNLHDVIGDASVFGLETGVNTGWQVSSNINASFTVPEPATVALLGFGLIGIGATSLRRRRNA